MSICPSVCLSVCDTHESDLNSSRYRKALHTIRCDDVSSLLMANFADQNLGVHINEALNRETPVSTVKIGPVISHMIWETVHEVGMLLLFAQRNSHTRFPH